MTARPPRVAVVGAGIGGCALALSLHAAGITEVEVHEAADEVREIGVGINLLPHAARELTELGLADALDAIAVRTGELSYHDRFGQAIWVEPRGLGAGYRWPQWSIHRGGLLGVLFRATCARLGDDRVHLGSRIGPDDLEDLDADVVVACDGVHSTLRGLVAPAEGPPLWNGITMWRGATETAPFLGGRRMVMAGVLRHRMVIYPILDLPDGRQLVNWVAEKQTEAGRPMPRQDWSAAVDRSEVLDHFGSFTFDWLDVPELIRGAEQVLAYPMVDREPLSTWRPPPGAPGHGRMTLLGDAAHPMYPVGSNGGSQAIIDARVLARELALAEPGTGLSVALDRYETARLPATAAIVRANRQAGPERCMEIVAERAPRGFTRVADVISDDELQEIVVSYRRTAGFDPEVLNTRPSLGVGRT